MAEHNLKLFDKRVVDRSLEKGLIKENEYNSYLKNLPDDEANAQWVKMDLDDSEMGSGSDSSGTEEES